MPTTVPAAVPFSVRPPSAGAATASGSTAAVIDGSAIMANRQEVECRRRRRHDDGWPVSVVWPIE